MNDTFKSLLSEVDILSLDILDTTLGRRCAQPEDAFILMEESLIRKHGPVVKGFANLRMSADPSARRLAWEQRQAEEVTLEDLYAVFSEDRRNWPVSTRELMDLELETEKRLLYPIVDAQLMIASARAQGKKVIFISDMYLPRPFCEERLRQNGFTDYDAIFLSSEVGVLKHTGNLFRNVLSTLQIDPSKILHVGDNPHGDGKQARRFGIRSHIVSRPIHRLDQFPNNPLRRIQQQEFRSGRESLLLGLSARGCAREPHHPDQLWYRIGYQIAGPLMYGYIRFLIERVRNRDIDHIYFLSRDGYILKQVYERLKERFTGCPGAGYLYASRRALNFASITQLDQATEDWLAQGIHLTVGDFLRRINLDPVVHKDDIVQEGFSGADQVVVEGDHYTRLRSLFRRILPDVLDAAQEERQIYLEYLRAQGVLDANPFVLVDVGWMTSIQHSFAKILHPVLPGLPIEGYYLGTYQQAIHRSDTLSSHIHYLMEYGQPPQALDTIRHCVCLLEFLFAAPEKTFLHMRRNASGELTPEMAPFHENEADLVPLEHIHKGVLEYVDEMLEACGPDPVEIYASEVLDLLHRFLAEPTEEEAHRFGEIHYADGYGSYFHHTQMAHPSGWKRLGLSKRNWKRDFKASHWPKGYYMRLNAAERLIFNLMHPSHTFRKPHR